MARSQPNIPSIVDLGNIAQQILAMHHTVSFYPQLLCEHIFTIAWTGFGKTLTFWLPLIFSTDSIIIIVTPLDILGNKEAIEVCMLLGVRGIRTSDNLDNAGYVWLASGHF